MCWLSLGGIRPLHFISTIISQGVLGPAHTETYSSSIVPWQFLLPLEQTGASGFLGTPQCLAPVSKQLMPVLLLPQVSCACLLRCSLFHTWTPSTAQRYPAHMAAYPGLFQADALSGLYSIHIHLPSGIPPWLGRQFHAHIVLFSVLCTDAYCRLPRNYHQMLGAAMAQHADTVNIICTQQTAPPSHLLHPNLPPPPDTCCLALCTCIHRHSSVPPQVSTACC